MDSGNSSCPEEAGSNQVTSGSVEKMKNRRKQQKLANQPKKPKVFKSDKKKFKLNKSRRSKSAKPVDLKTGDELNDKLTSHLTSQLTSQLTNQLSDKLTDKLTNKLNAKLNQLPEKSIEKKEISVKEVVAVAASLLLKSIASQTTHKSKCNLLTNLLTNKQVKLAESKFNCPNSLTINHQPLIAMFGGQNSNDKIEESISLSLKEADEFNGDKINEKLTGDRFNGSDKLDKPIVCNQDEHINCLNSNETHQIVISLLERLIDQQQNATNQLMQLNQLQSTKKTTTASKSPRKRNNERRKRQNKLKNQSNGLETVKSLPLIDFDP